MADDSDAPNSDWHLLAEFPLKTEPDSIQRAEELVAETLQELRIQPALAERIETTVIETLRGMLRRKQELPIHLRISVSGTSRGQAAEKGDQQKDPSWGFFLLEKQGNSSGKSYRWLELCLYQEAR